MKNKFYSPLQPLAAIDSQTRNSKNQLHSLNGEPSIVLEDGEKIWHKDNLRHRDIGPAIINPNGRRLWYWDGQEIE